jgi:hypothetical protein
METSGAQAMRVLPVAIFLDREISSNDDAPIA